MEEKLINAVRRHENLYNKRLLVYRNKIKRAASWTAISKELHLPEKVCQVRWKSLRDKYVKIVSESNRASGSGAEIAKSQWQYKQQMDFLREHVKTRKTFTNLTISKDEDNIESSPTSPLEDNQYDGIDGFEDTTPMFEMKYCAELPTVSTPVNTDSNFPPFEISNNSRKKARRDCDGESFQEFLNKMTTIAERRFASKDTSSHAGFFAMVREIFDDLPKDAVHNAKFFFLDYLRDQLEAAKNN